MNYNLISIDLDGTILSPDSETIHPVDREAVNACIEAGIYVILNSSRPPRSMMDHWKSLALKTPGIGYNGGIVWDFEINCKLKGWYFEESDLQKIFEILKNESHIWLEAQNLLIAEDVKDDEIKISIKRGGAPILRAPITTWNELPVNKIIIYGKNHIILSEKLRHLGFNTEIYSYPEMSEVRPKYVNKGSALKWLCNSLGIPMAQTLCIGDGESDIPMLKVAGLGVAMGNASSNVKKVADKTTFSYKEHGVAVALDKYALS